MNQNDALQVRLEILDMVKSYYRLQFGDERSFIPGSTQIHYGGRVFDERELQRAVEASLDFWLTEGDFARKFERGLKETLNVKHCALTNSGSSANLLAMFALTSDC